MKLLVSRLLDGLEEEIELEANGPPGIVVGTEASKVDKWSRTVRFSCILRLKAPSIFLP